MVIVGAGRVSLGNTEGKEVKWHETKSIFGLGAVGDGGHDGVFSLGGGVGGGLKGTDGTFHYVGWSVI